MLPIKRELCHSAYGHSLLLIALINVNVNLCRQGAQLSQRDCAKIRVIEYLVNNSRSYEMTLLSRSCVSYY